MRRRRKRKGCFLGCLGVLVALVALALFGAYLYLGTIVGSAIEAMGTRVTGVPVEVESVRIAPWSGEGTITGLTVGSPDGFRAERTASVGRIRIALEPRSIFDKEGPVRVRRVTVDGLSLDYELTARGSNVGTILDHVESVADSEREAPTEGGRKVVVDTLSLRGTRVHVSAHAGGAEAEREVDLPDIVLNDVGRKSGGATGYELALQIAQPLRDKAVEAGVDPDGRLEEAAESVRGASRALKEAAERVGERIRKSLGTAYPERRADGGASTADASSPSDEP